LCTRRRHQTTAGAGRVNRTRQRQQRWRRHGGRLLHLRCKQ
jgi:hypothetical protein